MFNALSQRTITSFFSTSGGGGGEKSTPKMRPSPSQSSVATSKDDEDSLVRKKAKQRRFMDSDDDEENIGEKDTISEDDNVSEVETKPRVKESRSKRRMSDLNSDSDSALQSNTPKKIKTYSGRDKAKTEKVQKAILSSSSSEAEESIEDDESNVKKESKSSPNKLPAKDQPSKTINSFFGPKLAQKKMAACEKTQPLDKKNDKEKFSKTGVVTLETYNPAVNDYHPVVNAPWNYGEKVPYLALAKTLETIEGVSSRLKMIDILANFFRSVIVLTPDDLLLCTYLCINKLAPAYEGIELGIGESLLIKAISQTTGRSVDSVRSELNDKGDLGIIAETSRSNQRVMFKPARLTVRGVYEKLREIALMAGNSSMTKKVEKIQTMLVACVQSEARFLIRSLGGRLRIGLAEQSLLAALAQAITMTPPGQDYPPEIMDASENLSAEKFKKQYEENSLILKTTYCECPSYDAIIPVLLKDGISMLPKKCKIQPGVPIKPMLAHPTKGVHEVLQRFDDAKFTCEYKYDGERAQIHVLDSGEVLVYSRNQENNTSKYPDLVSRIPKALKKGVKSCILDAETVAWDSKSQQILPFQVLSTRKRKDAMESNIKVQVCVFAFDLLYLNGKSLVTEPLQERRSLLHSSFDELEGEFLFVTSIDTDNMEKVGVFLEEAIKNRCEGLMIKTLDVDASYEIAKRSHKWLKLKKDYLDGVGDTLDLVVIGGYFGKGKRAGTYGGFLLSCYDPENEEFQTICKIGTGFKDEDLTQHSTLLKEHVIAKPKSYYRHDSSQEPDEWFETVQVWEVKCADLSVSPIYKAGVGVIDPQRGISLRFPRFVRIRDDKKPEEATSSSQVISMYRNQEQIKNQLKGSSSSKDEEEDFY